MAKNIDFREKTENIKIKEVLRNFQFFKNQNACIYVSHKNVSNGPMYKIIDIQEDAKELHMVAIIENPNSSEKNPYLISDAIQELSQIPRDRENNCVYIEIEGSLYNFVLTPEPCNIDAQNAEERCLIHLTTLYK